ncbi:MULTISPECIES: hypothetical protein [Actinoalloteichus]|uniref:Uncharacterized protein n=1 Tax=Actinoalloteichus fjordicus TaxID=1612552 RepID=A0AAC9L9V5_9PSEU|nr:MULTISPECIES: hypothetical protein [Actinoalloteichus]APU12692.1 hypothetical protein UA74_03045 [Actinoalloteichus fjordicus]APU18662.1 hypothetical protein UA75_03135 [Actinoalloteichus sp. GBA129-24]
MAGYDVVLHAGWEEPCFWFWVGDSPQYDHEIDEAAELLGLSPELVHDLTEWDDEFQAVYNDDTPQEPLWTSPEAEIAWLEKGQTLAARIKRESSVTNRVNYRGNGSIPSGSCVF